ncbi:hypothetical protein [Hyphomicrobium sp.]|uniref:hypothetical protein n=1 Tax=Hyphomicrobium sp. TaxID=82 RepID=UPI001D23D0A8|nr:hypothetical protein [Hyphomicrobium sp.]MBY0561492.1 hypothetical protein [Hyphomicrobium sp.]
MTWEQIQIAVVVGVGLIGACAFQGYLILSTQKMLEQKLGRKLTTVELMLIATRPTDAALIALILDGKSDR